MRIGFWYGCVLDAYWVLIWMSTGCILDVDRDVYCMCIGCGWGCVMDAYWVLIGMCTGCVLGVVLDVNRHKHPQPQDASYWLRQETNTAWTCNNQLITTSSVLMYLVYSCTVQMHLEHNINIISIIEYYLAKQYSLWKATRPTHINWRNNNRVQFIHVQPAGMKRHRVVRRRRGAIKQSLMTHQPYLA